MEPAPNLKRAYAALAVVSFFWGTTYLASRVAVQHIPGMYLASVRTLIAGSSIILFSLLRGRKFPDLKTLWQSALLGFVMISFSSGLSHWAVQYISAGLAAIIGATIPLWIAVFSGKKSLHPKTLAGLLLGFAGIAIIFYDHLSELFQSKFRFGVILASVSCITWAAGSVYSSKIKLNVSLFFGAGLQMFFAGIILFIYSTITHIKVPLDGLPILTLSCIAYLTLIGSVLTYSCFVYAVQHLPPAKVGIYAYINPIVAILLGHLLLHERLNLLTVAGAAVTIGGVYLVNTTLNQMKK